MKLLIYSANIDNYDHKQENVEQDVPYGIDLVEYHCYDDSNTPRRFNSMTPRLQARLCKMMTWQFKPDYDYYLWVDSSCRLPKEDSAAWFMDQLGDSDIAVFRHNKRQTVQEEADYLKARLIDEKEGRKQNYVLSRYENEDIDGQMAVVDPTAQLFASTALIYRNNQVTRDLMTVWWLNTSMFHSIDQLSLPHAITHTGAEVSVIDEDYLKCSYLEYTR